MEGPSSGPWFQKVWYLDQLLYWVLYCSLNNVRKIISQHGTYKSLVFDLIHYSGIDVRILAVFIIQSKILPEQNTHCSEWVVSFKWGLSYVCSPSVHVSHRYAITQQTTLFIMWISNIFYSYKGDMNNRLISFPSQEEWSVIFRPRS
jgi:hypothetical protein